MPAVIRHVQPDHYRVTFFDAQDNTHYDGMAVLWFEDPQRARRWYTSQDAATVFDDGFAELTDQKPVVLVCEEHVIVDGPRPADAVEVPPGPVRVIASHGHGRVVLAEHAMPRPGVGRAGRDEVLDAVRRLPASGGAGRGRVSAQVQPHRGAIRRDEGAVKRGVGQRGVQIRGQKG